MALAFAPETNACGPHSGHDAQALNLCVECRVPQKTPNKLSGFIIGDIQPY
jgi:hypothetical protein